MEDKPEKKERVMHTRIPDSLDKQLKSKAQGLGVSVSNLVRNVLASTFDLVDVIVSDSADITRIAATERQSANDNQPNKNAKPNYLDSSDVQSTDSTQTPGSTLPSQHHEQQPATVQNSPPQYDQIIGWQPMILNLNAVCFTCNDIMKKGSEAAIGIGSTMYSSAATNPNVKPHFLCAQCLKDLSHEPNN